MLADEPALGSRSAANLLLCAYRLRLQRQQLMRSDVHDNHSVPAEKTVMCIGGGRDAMCAA